MNRQAAPHGKARSNNPYHTTQGFTMLELLVVLAIIGIIAAAFYVNFSRSTRAAELREAATQVSADLRRARSTAQRTGQAVSVKLPGSVGSGTYTVGGSTVTLPHGIQLYCKTPVPCATTEFTYSAPHGEIDIVGRIMSVRSPASGVSPLEIRIVGVTGKVILTRETP